MGTHLDQQRRQSPEIGEDRADGRIGRMGLPYIVGDPGTEPIRGEERIDLLLLLERLPRQGQIRIWRHHVRTRRQGHTGIPKGDERRQDKPASRRLTREHDLGRGDTLIQQADVGGSSVLDRGRIGVFGSQPVVERDAPAARSPHEVTHQRHRRRRRADDVDTTVEVEDHALGLVAPDGDLDAGDTSDLHGLLPDIGSHGHLGHELAERSPHGLDIRGGVEPALAQDGVQLELLLLAHLGTVPRVTGGPANRRRGRGAWTAGG